MAENRTKIWIKTVTSKYGLESVKTEKSLIYSDFILSGCGWLRLFPSHHLPMQNVLYLI